VRHAEQKGRCALVLGIQGGPASGKSTLAGLLAERGAGVIDADRIGHEILERPHVKQALTQAFGREILDRCGAVNRARLAEAAFADEQELRKLNDIVHPPLLEEIRRRVDGLKHDGNVGLIVLDAALLTEWNLDEELCDLLVFVDAPVAARGQRAVASGRMSAEQFAKRSGAQLPDELKKGQADYVVNNAGSPAQLEQQAEKLWDVMQTGGLRARTQGARRGPEMDAPRGKTEGGET